MKWMVGVFVLACSVLVSQAQTLTRFDVSTVGSSPTPLIQASDGNFYGTVRFGGANNNGAVFKITPAGQVTTFSNVGAAATDGSAPSGQLLQATNGFLYGVMKSGGNGDYGTIFQVSPAGAYQPIYSPGNFNLGTIPLGSLIQGKDGNFYGTMSLGGAGGVGTVFKLTLPNTVSVVHSFAETDGANPITALLQASDGSIYGVATAGGTPGCVPYDGYYDPSPGCGAVFKVAPDGTFSDVYVFSAANPTAPGADGDKPLGPLVEGADGNLYGVTIRGGAFNCGTIYKLTPSGAFTSIYSFTGGSDGGFPDSGLVLASDGNFYGMASSVIFSITPAGKFATVYSFGSNDLDLEGPLVQGTDGNLWGSSDFGGLFKLTLPSAKIPTIAPSGGVLNGASFQPGISSGSWVTINGTNLAPKADSWTIVNGALPTSLDGVSVTVGGQPAYIEYVSPTQINALAPNVPSGIVPVAVTNTNGTSHAANAQLSAETPAFFQWGSYAVATHQDYSYAVKNGTFAGLNTVAAKPGDVIILWGTGFGPTSPPMPTGTQTPSTTTYNTASLVSITVGGKSATVYGAALAPGYAGLYQIAIQIPAGLANGDYPVVASISGASSPSAILITVQQ